MTTLVGLLFGSGVWFVVQSISHPKHLKKTSQKPNTWPEFIDEISSGVQVGMSIQEAFFDARTALPPHHKALFDQAYFQTQHGASFNACLENLAFELKSKDFSRLVALLVISNNQGLAQLATLLHDFASAIRRDSELIKEIVSKYQTNKIAARVASVAPLFVLLFTASRSEVRDVYLTGEGVVVLSIIALISLGGYISMAKISSLPGLTE